MITDNLTNTVYFSSLLPEKCPILSASILEVLREHGISFNYLKGTKDIWCRDYMPIQIQKDRFIAYKYTPDYLQDKRYIRLQTNPEDVDFDGLLPTTNEKSIVETIKINLIMDGGNVVKCGDTVVMTEKVFMENNDKTRDEVEQILRDTFQCDILFLPWDREEYLGHSDGIVHYAGDGKILLTNYNDFSIYFYRRFRKALETRFAVIPLKYHVKRKHTRSWSYINFLQVGKLVLVPQLGIEEDRQALEQIGSAMPDYEVVGIPALEAVRRGGALNCISWNIQS